MMPRPQPRSKWIILFDILCYSASVLFSIVRWNNDTYDSVTHLYLTNLTPVAFASMIWVAIYTLVMLYGIWEAFPPNGIRQEVKAVGFWFILCSLCQLVWYPLWCHHFFRSGTV